MSNQTDWLYTDIVKDHFMNPRNFLKNEENFSADGDGITGNIKCGDQMRFLIKVDQEKEIITDCRWQTFVAPVQLPVLRFYQKWLKV
jgi:nitrogen fixation NifU-like protein